MLRHAYARLATAPKNIARSVKQRIKDQLIASPARLTAAQKQFWDHHGYLVLSRHFSAKQVQSTNALVDRLWAERRHPSNPLVIDTFIGTPNQRRMYFRDAPDDARLVPYKLNDLFLEHPEVLAMSTDARLNAIIGELLEGDAIVCNNLTFERGSQQEFHFDTFYMPAPVENKMVASWIALEDAHADSGPLRYYPGSHKIPPYRFSDGRLQPITEEFPDFDRYIELKLKEYELEVATFEARRGDVFIWHSQLFHGGSPINDPSRTRKSLVTHYFRAQDFPPSLVAFNDGKGYLKREHLAVASA